MKLSGAVKPISYFKTHASEVLRNMADRLLAHLEETVQKLETFPLRGHVPPELEQISVYNFREIHYKPYRIIYEIRKTEVFVHCVLDGKLDLQELLQKRVLR